MSDINALVAIKAQCQVTESIFSNLGDEADLRSQPGTAHRLIGTFTAVVHAITCSKKCLACARQALDLHGQPGRVTADDGDARGNQSGKLRNMTLDFLSAVRVTQRVTRSGRLAKDAA